MIFTLSFRIKILKTKIAACLREIQRGVLSYLDTLICLEGQLDALMETKPTQEPKPVQLTIFDVKVAKKMKVQVKTGSESHTTNWRSAMVTVNGKPIYEALKPLEKPEWELVGNKGKHGKWCVAEYELPAGAKVKFTAKSNGKDTIEFEFVVGSIDSVDVDGYIYNNATCGWIVSI